MFGQFYMNNQNNMKMNMNMNMIYQNNMNMMNQNNMNMNQNNMNMNQNNMNMNQNNMNMNQNYMNMNQNNMNMNQNYMSMNQNYMNMNQNYMNMNQNNINMSQNYMNMNQNNMNGNFNNFPLNNMNINNNMYNNMGMNNLFNMKEQNNNNPKLSLMKNLYNQYKFLEDPFLIQKGIALGMNNNQPYKMYNSGGNQQYNFFTMSTNYGQPNNLSPNKINIRFITLKGNKHIRIYNKNDKIKDALENFLESVGVNKNAITQIQFLYNATNLNNLNKDMTLNDFGIRDLSPINVIDLNNIIGA